MEQLKQVWFFNDDYLNIEFYNQLPTLSIAYPKKESFAYIKAFVKTLEEMGEPDHDVLDSSSSSESDSDSDASSSGSDSEGWIDTGSSSDGSASSTSSGFWKGGAIRWAKGWLWNRVWIY